MVLLLFSPVQACVRLKKRALDDEWRPGQSKKKPQRSTRDSVTKLVVPAQCVHGFPRYFSGEASSPGVVTDMVHGKGRKGFIAQRWLAPGLIAGARSWFLVSCFFHVCPNEHSMELTHISLFKSMANLEMDKTGRQGSEMEDVLFC